MPSVFPTGANISLENLTASGDNDPHGVKAPSEGDRTKGSKELSKGDLKSFLGTEAKGSGGEEFGGLPVE